jgi:sugar lactone lactonase YvrE
LTPEQPDGAAVDAPAVLLDGLVFPEALRWHQGALWFVDVFGQRVMTVDGQGTAEEVAQLDDRLNGLGFLPDGIPIVVLMDQQVIKRLNAGQASLHADLTGYGGEFLNDMVVDTGGRAYVSLRRPRQDARADVGDCIVLVEPHGASRIVATGGLVKPNGMVITPDGKSLIVACGPTHSLISFDILADGRLTDMALYADTGDHGPDGICLDSEGGIWMGSPSTHSFVRVLRGGHSPRIISTGRREAIACALGDSDRRTLYMGTAQPPRNPVPGLGGNLHLSSGFIEMTRVDAPGCGLP